MISLRQKIAQMLIMGFCGLHIDETSPVVKWLEKDGLGGVLLFDFDVMTQRSGKNLKNLAQIKQLNAQLNRYAEKSLVQNNQALLIALDYEGGGVDRLINIPGSISTLKASEMMTLSDEQFLRRAQAMASLLKQLGFNLNFAPVIDLNLNENQGIIGKLGRSFSHDPKAVAHAAKLFVETFAQDGIICSYKHFPGHGSALGDTHQGMVDVSATFQKAELEPYVELFETVQAPCMVMTAHVINRQLDSTGLPATLSYPILTHRLRQTMNFKGVIVSDDLQMQAITNHYSLNETLHMSINAGSDMLIFGNQLGFNCATEIVDRIERLVQLGLIDVARIEEAYQRILTLKCGQKTPSSIQ